MLLLPGRASTWTSYCPACCAALRHVKCIPSATALQDCFVLSDPNLPDMPIVYASPAFLKMTGYSCTEVLGRNCRFLQVGGWHLVV